MEFGNVLPYDIRISGSHNKGFHVTVGCCNCVFTNKEELLKAMEEYLDDPKGMERKYSESGVNEITMAEAAPPPNRALLRTQPQCSESEGPSDEMR